MNQHIRYIYGSLISKRWLVGKNGWKFVKDGFIWHYNKNSKAAAIIYPYIIRDKV